MIMMSEPLPWDGIAIPVNDLNVLQVPGSRAADCFWAKDKLGSYMFLMELDGDHQEQFRKSKVTVHGIKIDLQSRFSGGQQLALTLDRHVDTDLFYSLCRTLATALENASDSASSLAVALAHIKRWKAFLAGRGGKSLTPEEVRGLFAEITFLGELFEKSDSAENVVASWLGPERSHQDFIFGNTAVEIKSLSGKERSCVRISSEDQMESLNDDLFLRIYRLSEVSDTPSGLSLNGAVRLTAGKLDDAGAIEAFENKLATHGYAPIPEYDTPIFVLSEIRSYQVSEGFPRLVRSQLPAGIARVSYDLEMEAIAPFQCDENDIFKDL